MRLFVDFCVFTWIWLNLPDRNLKLFWTSIQNKFRFWSVKFSQIQVKAQKSTKNPMSSFGLMEKYGAVTFLLSCDSFLYFWVGIKKYKCISCQMDKVTESCLKARAIKLFTYQLVIKRADLVLAVDLVGASYSRDQFYSYR